MKTLIIAEAGVNHNGDSRVARSLIDAAAAAGADVVKFQTFRADDLATASAPKAGYQKESGTEKESQRDMLKRLELTREMHEDLIAHAKTRGISFFSTAFDLASLDMLDDLGMAMFKVPSGELTNLPYLRKVASFGRPVILSTGMATLEEVSAALDALNAGGIERSKVTVLHCTSEYPSPMDDVNLKAMVAMRDQLGVAVGYSDHTRGIEVPIAAVALGATIVEKHITLDRTMSGPDHAMSLEPGELAQMVAAIRNVEAALGSAAKAPTTGESAMKLVARKSLVAATSIHAGEKLTAENVIVKRPGGGVSPMRWDEAIGSTARRDFAPDELIEL